MLRESSKVYFAHKSIKHNYVKSCFFQDNHHIIPSPFFPPKTIFEHVGKVPGVTLFVPRDHAGGGGID